MNLCPAPKGSGKDSCVRPVPHQLQFPFPSFQMKINSSRETQLYLLQEQLRQHLAEKEKLTEERLQQEETLKARVKRLMEEKSVRWSPSVSLLLETDEMGFPMRNRGRVLRWRNLSNSLLGTKLIKEGE